MLMVKALAGTGKTTTAMWGLGVRVPKNVICSEEQKAIIKEMRSYKWDTCAAQAFNTAIANELKERVPSGVDAATSNAFGWRAWRAWLAGKPCTIEEYKTGLIFKELVGNTIPWKERIEIERSVSSLIRLCKCNLVEPTPVNLGTLADYYDIDCTPQIIEWCSKVWDISVMMIDVLDYDDQNFMPIYHNIDMPRYDLVVIDELQDLNPAKQEMAFRLAREGVIVGIGDEHQAIYGFSGADANSMDNVWKRMQALSDNAKVLPLNITRRCPHAVVREANKYVSELVAHKLAPPGSVAVTPEKEVIGGLIKREDSSMVVCRTNAPLTSLAFTLIGAKRRCYIQGRDIGQGLKREITKHNVQDLSTALSLAIASIEKRIDREQRSTFPKQSKLDGYQDKITCLTVLCDRVDSISEFEAQVDSLFKDRGSPGDHQLTTVHKAKGLEHPNVVILKPSKLPMIFKSKAGKKSQSPWQVQQERNLAYVAYTRSMDTLTYAEESKSSDVRDVPVDY